MSDELLDLTIKYLKGSISAEDSETLKHFIAESDKNKRAFDEICDIWHAGVREKDKSAFNSFEALKKVRNRLGFGSNQTNKGHVIRYIWIYRIAAIFIIAFGLGVLTNYFFTIGRPSTNLITEITAPMGSKSKITMPDGSKVVLNAGSSISYNGDFNIKTREVTLSGEAYFDVSKQKKMPFCVKTNSAIEIKVLGTSFNVKSYPNEGTVETTLVSGSLILEQSKIGKKEQILLSPNQRATFIKSEGLVYLSEIDNFIKDGTQNVDQLKGKVLLSKYVDTELFTAWKDGKLVFRNEKFESLALKLERWYGVKICINNEEIKSFHFNGTIENETINDVMEIIAYTLPIQFKIQHNVVSIFSNIAE